MRCETALTANVGVREVRNGLHDQNPLVWSFEGTVKVQTGIKCWCASYVYPHLNEGQQLSEAQNPFALVQVAVFPWWQPGVSTPKVLPATRAK